MALIAVAAAKGSPGVTTTAVAVAALWPRAAVLAECDPSGADLPYRLVDENDEPLAQSRGVVTLAAAVRSQVTPEVVWEHTQRVDGGLPVLVGPASPRHAEAMAGAWTPISGLLRGMADADVIADCGRVLGETPVVPVLRRADLILMVARGTTEGVAHLRHGLGLAAQAINTASRASSSALERMAVVVIADPREAHVDEEVREVLRGAPGLGEIPVLGVIALDPRGATRLRGRWGRGLDRSALISSARTVAARAHARVQLPAPPAEVSSPAATGVSSLSLGSLVADAGT